MAENFLYVNDVKKEVNHIDGNKFNNKVNNLEWCTHKENMKHAKEEGLIIGKPVFQYTLNKDFIQKWNSISEASKDTGINQSQISKVCSNKCNRKTAGRIYLEF